MKGIFVEADGFEKTRRLEETEATEHVDPLDPTRPADANAPTIQTRALGANPEAETEVATGEAEFAEQPTELSQPDSPPTAPVPTRPLDVPESLGVDQSLTGTRLLNRYLVGERIGAGGFGSVYRATDELKSSSGEEAEIAVKIMDAAQFQGRMDVIVQEVSRSHQVSHPNILRVYDVHVDGQIAFMTMEVLEGEPLSERISRAMLENHGRDGTLLPLAEVDTIAESLCTGLQHCHEHRLVHADIKPPNVFVCEDGRVKLLDLGIAQIAGSRSRISGYSARYASAQQMEGEKAHPKDDLFSLGCMLYLCLSGEHPFDGLSAQQARTAGASPDLAKLPRRYRKAVAGALAFERDERLASAAALWRSVSPAIRRRNAILGGLAATAAAGMAGAALLGQSIGEENIAVSDDDQVAARAQYESAMAAVSTDAGRASSSLASALVLNPYLEEAAISMVELLNSTSSKDPTAYSLVWADFGRALTAAPTSDSLRDAAAARVDALLTADTKGLRRSRVLSEYRAPLCVLPQAGYRATEIEALAASLKIGC